MPTAMPKSLLVIGSGAIGIEFACFFRTLGAEVTVVEVLPQILPVEDEEIAAFARKRFEKQGMKILTGAKVTKLEKGGEASPRPSRTARAARRRSTAERLISAVGVVGNIENLGLEKLGREDRPRHHRRPTGSAAPNVPGIYAIGDVAGPPLLAHKAEHEGVVLRRGDQGAARRIRSTS